MLGPYVSIEDQMDACDYCDGCGGMGGECICTYTMDDFRIVPGGKYRRMSQDFPGKFEDVDVTRIEEDRVYAIGDRGVEAFSVAFKAGGKLHLRWWKGGSK